MRLAASRRVTFAARRGDGVGSHPNNKSVRHSLIAPAGLSVSRCSSWARRRNYITQGLSSLAHKTANLRTAYTARACGALGALWTLGEQTAKEIKTERLSVCLRTP
jgi:hypothetical protein